MATLEELEARIKALEDAQAAEPTAYYTSKYTGEEIDELLAKLAAQGGGQV